MGLRSNKLMSYKELPSQYLKPLYENWPLRAIKAQPCRQWLAHLPQFYVHAIADQLT
jgi:hypothetical protein